MGEITYGPEAERDDPTEQIIAARLRKRGAGGLYLEAYHAERQAHGIHDLARRTERLVDRFLDAVRDYPHSRDPLNPAELLRQAMDSAEQTAARAAAVEVRAHNTIAHLSRCLHAAADITNGTEAS